VNIQNNFRSIDDAENTTQKKENSMKRLALILLLVLTTGCSGNGIVVREYDAAHLLHLSEPRELKDFSDLKKYAGYLEKGDTVPLRINLDTDLIGISQKSIDFVIKQKLFFMVKTPDAPSKEEFELLKKMTAHSIDDSEQDKLMEELLTPEFFKRYMLYVSKDAVHWAPICDGEAIKQVLEVKGGSFSFGFGVDHKAGVRSVLTIKTQK
jgi:hypothetical protein